MGEITVADLHRLMQQPDGAWPDHNHAFAGDQPSKERVDFLRSQMKAADIKLATNAAMAFAPLPAVQEANNL